MILDLPKALPRTKTTSAKLPLRRREGESGRGSLSRFLFLSPSQRRSLSGDCFFVSFNTGDAGFNTGKTWASLRWSPPSNDQNPLNVTKIVSQ